MHYTNQDGLPSSYIKDIEQDQFGFIWIANRENVCRFDGYQFQSFSAVGNDSSFNLRANTLYRTADTLLFARAVDGAFYYFDYPTEQFRPHHQINTLNAEGMVAETDSGLWYLKSGQLHHFHLGHMKSFGLKEVFPGIRQDTGQVTIFAVSGRALSFVYTLPSGKEEVALINNGRLFTFPSPFEAASLLYLDSYGHIWVGHDQQGLSRIDPTSGELDFYSKEAKGNRALTHNFVHVIREDAQRVLWIGSEGGLCRWSPEGKIFARTEHSVANPDGLSSNPIYAIHCDPDGNMWLGTYFSGINLWNSKGSFFQTLKSGTGDLYLGGNTVSSFVEDKQGNIWVGLEDLGLNRVDRRTGRVKKYPVGEEIGGLSYGNIHDLYFEDDRTLWIATYTGGINILDIATGKFSYLNTHNTPGLVSNDIYAFCSVGDSVFVSTSLGVSLYHRKTRHFEPFRQDVFKDIWVESISRTPGTVWFSSRTRAYRYDVVTQHLEWIDGLGAYKGINFIKADSKNRVWVGDSYLGLCFLDASTGRILRRYGKSQGFPGSWIYGMQEGLNDWYWVATDEGLVKLDPETGTSFLYNRDSGVPFSQFNYRAAFKDSHGIVYMGSNEGMIYFDENNPTISGKFPRVVLTGFKLFNQRVVPDAEGSVLQQAITLSDKVVLEHEQNVFTIEFSALNYINEGHCHYAYYLEGFETDYNFAGNRNFATYTNLDPGTYTFKVIASFDNSTWETSPATLQIVIKPPFWRSAWGYGLYLGLMLLTLVLIALVTSNIQKSKAQALLERRERVHAVEMNQLKLEFFTNISHELRTPLTLIVGPLSRLINNEKVSPYVKDRLAGINLNAHRLLQLLNQLLEFRKIEQGKEDLQVCEGEICGLFQNLSQSFELTAEENNLTLEFDCSGAREVVWFDPSKVEKILINLISNSFKFTNAGGKISVKAKIKERQPVGKVLHLTVRDTGKGMESRMVNRVFERFYQLERNENRVRNFYGTGIGLSFVHSLVHLHKGRVWVKSKLNVGTIFKIDLPVERSAYQDQEVVHGDYLSRLSAMPVITAPGKKPAVMEESELSTSDKPKILLVEDNEELMEFVAGALLDSYAICKAANGSEALEMLREHAVDLILSDVMMPVMDGFEFARRVKTDFETSHIPVILLTAKSGVDSKFEGLKTGADFYIEKPFLAHILEQNIRNVLSTRRNLIKKYKRDAYMPPTELTHSDSDKKFIEQLTQIIKSNITKTDLDVTFLTTEAGLSRTMLHLKLKKLADCSATEFINIVRLKEAVKLMAEEHCNVSEAAYRTGFSSPTYFTRRFKQYYGQSPKDFIQQETRN